MVYALAVLSLVVGSVLAIVQTNVKRMLAYSSISHAGFILLGVAAASEAGTSAALFYLLAYTFMVAGSFGVVTLDRAAPATAGTRSTTTGASAGPAGPGAGVHVFLLAQAGVPLTGGFLAKFYVIGAVVEEGLYPLAVIAMVSAVIAAFLYLRIDRGHVLRRTRGRRGGFRGAEEPPSWPVRRCGSRPRRAWPSRSRSWAPWRSASCPAPPPRWPRTPPPSWSLRPRWSRPDLTPASRCVAEGVQVPPPGSMLCAHWGHSATAVATVGEAVTAGLRIRRHA